MSTKYAVVKIKDKQFLVKEGDKITAHQVKEGDKIEVLLLKDADTMDIGMPFITKGGVQLSLIADKRVKTEVRRFKSKSRYKRNKSHSQIFSSLLIKSIDSALKESGIVTEKETEIKKKKAPKAVEAKSPKKMKVAGLESLGLSPRVENALKDAGIESIKELKSKTKEDLDQVKGLGEKSVGEILKKLKK